MTKFHQIQYELHAAGGYRDSMFNFVKSVMWQVYTHNEAATLVPFIAMPSNDVKVTEMYSEEENMELLL